jgi:hypothetical protein
VSGEVLFKPPERSHFCDHPDGYRIGWVWRCTGCGKFYELKPVTGSQRGICRMHWFPRTRIRWRKLAARTEGGSRHG